ncbi:tyrosine-type recombinase/integrase [Fibrella forsythiae]|uniref:Site-specific integrase n=1 Tax=Fibrella forsythiae TaxID=2817061 RepID=A0ABS3JBJ4_9BACT|nr:site-specific integrase [Fibrella forsythiae]MBO0947360.1 site-specific integrase [Fibrella forsythiae]
MNTDIPSVKLSYDRLESGDYSIKIRISLGKERVRYALPAKEAVVVSPANYDKLVIYHQQQNKRRVSEEIRFLYDQISPFLEKAEKLCEMIPFTFAAFKVQFYNKTQPGQDDHTVMAVMKRLEEENDAQGRPGNADAFKDAANSLTRFLQQLVAEERTKWLGTHKQPSPPLRFEQITPAFLEAYETWMLRAGKSSQKKDGLPTAASLTTVGIYSRSIRTAFNEAISKKIVPADLYPFGRGGYVVAAGRNPKKALKRDIIREIRSHQLEPGSMAERSRDLWVFSYLSNGLNFADICQMRWSQINYADETITVIRKKTSRTQRGNQIKIVATLFPETRQIIDRWGNAAKGSSDFVFPFLTPDMDARQQRSTTKQIIKLTNKYMARLGEEIGIAEEVKTYAARHSFGSALLKSGADLNLIKNKYGHSSLRTTESYLSDFEDDEVKTMLRDSLL